MLANATDFPILGDSGNEVAAACALRFELPELHLSRATTDRSSMAIKAGPCRTQGIDDFIDEVPEFRRRAAVGRVNQVDRIGWPFEVLKEHDQFTSPHVWRQYVLDAERDAEIR
jgi:hypothetical protein